MQKRWNAIALILLALFAVLPLLLSIGYALCYSFGVTGVLSNGFTTAHWSNLFSDSNVLFSFLYSAAIAAVTVAIAVAAALFIALRHYPSFKKGALSYIIYLPLSFPAMVSAFFFFQALSKAGLLSRIFYNTHLTTSIDAFPDLVNDKWGIGIIAAQLFICFPFFLLLFIARMDSEGIAQYGTAAQTLGATEKQFRRKIAVPMLLQKTWANIILYFIFIFGAYEIPVLLGRSRPEMISVLAVRKLQKFNLLDIPQGYALAVVYTIFIFLILLILLKKQKLAYDI